MKNIFLIELLRHRNLAIGVAAFHFIVLYYLSTLGVALHSFPFVIMWLFALIALGGGFGVYQMALHKRSNDWLYLLHRPLSAQRIFAGLALAGCVLCAVAIVLPALAMLVVMESDGLRGVEARQYLLLPFVTLVATCSYFCGCFARLGSSRLSFLALLAIGSSLTAFLQNSPHLALLPVLIGWSLYLAISTFKPDLARIPRRPLAWVLTELPIQYACLWLIVSVVSMAQQTSSTISGTNTYRNPAPGSELHVRRLAVPELMQFALENSTHPDAAFLLQQVSLAESIQVVSPENVQYRQQLPLAYSHLRLADAERNTTWIFDHSEMLYGGYDNETSALKGWLGPAGFHMDTTPPAARFPEVPRTSGNEFLIGSHTLSRVDWDNLQLHQRFANDGPDRFTDSLTVTENATILLSDTKLYLFSTAELRDAESALRPRALLETTPSLTPENRRLAVTELIDGYLVAMMVDLTPSTIGADFVLFNRARLQLFRTREGAPGELITDMHLPTSFSNVIVYQEFIASPGMRLLTDLYWGLVLGKSAERTLPAFFVDFPAYILLLAAMVSALSAGLTAWLLRASAVPRSTKIFWIAGNAFTGLAGLLSFLLGYYWRRTDGLRAGTSP